MRYRLRTLLLVLAAGPAMGPVFSCLIIIAMLVAITVATWISFWPDRRFRRELASREPLDDAQFFTKFYAASDVPPEIPRRLRPIYCKIFDVEVSKLHPHDRPPLLEELDLADFMEDIETEFGVTISEKDAERIDGSFDSIARYLARHLHCTK